MIAVGSEDFERGAAIAERLEAHGRREAVMAEAPLAGALMAWCNLTLGRPDGFRTLAAAVPPGHEADVLHYVAGHLEPGPPRPRPSLTGSPLDALVVGNDFYYGRFDQVNDDRPLSDWIDAITGGPMRIGALRALGQTQRALELYEAARVRQRPSGLSTARSGQSCCSTRAAPRRRARRSRSCASCARGYDAPLLLMVIAITVAKVALRLDRDLETARGAARRRRPARRRVPVPVHDRADRHLVRPGAAAHGRGRDRRVSGCAAPSRA